MQGRATLVSVESGGGFPGYAFCKVFFKVRTTNSIASSRMSELRRDGENAVKTSATCCRHEVMTYGHANRRSSMPDLSSVNDMDESLYVTNSFEPLK